MLTVRGRRLRGVATAVAACLLLAGSVWGSDDDFPFGPFRMYAGVNDPNGDVVSSYLQAVLPSGKAIRVDERGTGLRRAELEAEVGGFIKDPATLQTLAQAHAELHPDEAPYIAVQVVQLDQHLHHAALAEQTTKIVAQWRRT
ncbi:hypothetical protein acdb102_44250 [Acidothermaceae bacterium B102]|nr:hypothetical protein acdb102_44250 [Acidothermaceae bacterium B102]